MDWTLAIDRNRDALLRILAMLFAMAGLRSGGSVAALPRFALSRFTLPRFTLPRHIRSHVLRLLRPAESAVRRLIVIEARRLAVPQHPQPAAPVAPIPRGNGGRIPSFRLFDPRKRFDCRPKRAKGPEPRALFIGGDALRSSTPPPAPGDAVGAATLYRRLHALRYALDDLPRQARRLGRRMASREQAPPGPRRAGPLRPGWPPGHRMRPIHEVDDILRDCQALAFALPARPPP